jgi:DNA-binding response OmpR family regulator
MRKILLVEDDTSLGEILTERLSKEYATQYEVHWRNTFQSAWDFISNYGNDENGKPGSIDLVIFDVGLPDGDGFELAQKMRAISKALFIFLTAQAEAESRLKGFELGAEEYIPKPFHLKELLIRVRHVLDAHAPVREVKLKTCEISFSTQTVKKSDGTIEFLPPTDIKVLQLLIDKAPQVLSRDDIIDEVWGMDSDPTHLTIDYIFVRLRHSLGDESYIRSVRGIGYQWVNE